MEVCAVCKDKMQPVFVLRILQKHNVQCFHCSSCGFVRTEKPYWLNEAYSSAIAMTDTGIMERNMVIANKLACLLFYCLEPNGTYLDVGGGYGILTRLMRDYGFDYYWEDKHCQNLVARGFEAANASLPFVSMSAFEVIEHTEDPVAFVAELMERHCCRTLVFTTETYSSRTGPRSDWWYLSPATGQHISFFECRTLACIASRLHLAFHSYAGLHLFTDKSLRNRWVLRLPGLGRQSGPLGVIVKRRMGSRVWADHMAMSRGAVSTNPESAASLEIELP